MKKAIKQTWLKALQSGDYAQGTNYLCEQGDTEQRFCCLGVLINESEGFDELPRIRPDDLFCSETAYQDDSNTFPSSQFLQSVGLEEELAYELAEMNDSGHTFEQIAQLIAERA